MSDGSAILGLGNLGGLSAMPVMEGKCVLFKEFGGVDAFPICLDTQNSDEIVNIVKNLSISFGGINLEDIASPRCFEIERRLNDELDIPVFHDDQHGTAIIVLAGLINALKIVNKDIKDVKIVVNGPGAAGTAITWLLRDFGAKILRFPTNTAYFIPLAIIWNGTRKNLRKPLIRKISAEIFLTP